MDHPSFQMFQRAGQQFGSRSKGALLGRLRNGSPHRHQAAGEQFYWRVV
jgi:hypothetical protein